MKIRICLLVIVLGLFFLDTTEAQDGCAQCLNAPGDQYAYVLESNGESACTSIGASGCLYRYEGTDDLFCSGGGYSQFSSCPEAKEYFIVAGGETDQSTQLNSALIYDSDWNVTNLPDMPVTGGSLTGGVTGNRILICSRTNCYTWSGSNPTVWNPEIAPPAYTLQTAVTTYQGVWFSGGFPASSGRDLDLDNLDEKDLIDAIKTQHKHDGGFNDRASNPLVATFFYTIDEATGTATVREATGVELTESRYYHCAIENGDTPIITGGANLVPNYFTHVERYNVVTGQVDALPPLNDARVNHGCTRFRQNPSDNEYSLIVAGGWLSGEYNPKVEILVPGATAWTSAPDLPAFRLFTAMANLGDKAYMIGGGEVVNGTTWVYQDDILLFNTTLGAFQDTTMHLNPTRKSMRVFSVPRQAVE